MIMQRKMLVGLLTLAVVAVIMVGYLAVGAANRAAAQVGLRDDGLSQPKLAPQPVTIPAQYAKDYLGPLAINLPPGFSISLFASLPVSSARSLAVGACGDLFVGTNVGKVYRLPDRNHDGIADSVSTFVTSSSGDIQHGVEYWQGHYYIASQSDVMRYDQATCDSAASNGFPLISGLPFGGQHNTKTTAHGLDGSLYVSVGSSCDSCVETDIRRATVLRFDNNLRMSVFAGGLRNSVGIAFRPGTNELWGSENGYDSLGDNEPAEEVNLIRQNAVYGWPYCYNDGTPTNTWSPPKPNYCRDYATNPAFKLPAHGAPMMLAFSENTALAFPSPWKRGFFLAERGSRYRSSCVNTTGYRLLYIPAFAPHTGDIPALDFATDPASDCFHAWRPVGLAVGGDGALYLSTDTQVSSTTPGSVYRITYSAAQAREQQAKLGSK